MFGRDEKVSPVRLTAVQYIILAIFLLLAYGLWRLQVSQSDFYSSLAEKNRIAQCSHPRASRKNSRSRRPHHRRQLSFVHRSAAARFFTRSECRRRSDRARPASGSRKKCATGSDDFAGVPQYQPIYLKDDITPDELAFIESHRNELPELDTIMAHRRLYPRNGFMAHLIGYVGEVSEDMLNQPRWELYNPGDVVGQSGVELEYNSILMGNNGSRQVVVNSHGKEVRAAGREAGRSPASR